MMNLSDKQVEDLKRTILTEIDKWGRDVDFYDENNQYICSYRCFIEPLRYKNKMYLEGEPTEIGFDDGGSYLVIAPPECPFDEAYVTLKDDRNDYYPARWELIHARDTDFYIWAVVDIFNEY